MKKVIIIISIIAGALCALVFIFFLIKLLDLGFLKSEITMYSAICREKVISGTCKDSHSYLDKVTFKVSSKMQKAVYWGEREDGTEKIGLSTNCIVTNRKNWSCMSGNKSSEFGFTGGQFWERNSTIGIWQEIHDTIGIPEGYLNENIYYVSKIEWFKMQCEDDINNPYWCFFLTAIKD